jgi:hypothetical protein
MGIITGVKVQQVFFHQDSQLSRISTPGGCGVYLRILLCEFLTSHLAVNCHDTKRGSPMVRGGDHFSPNQNMEILIETLSNFGVEGLYHEF